MNNIFHNEIVFRDVLFLAISVMGRQHVDLSVFHKEFSAAVAQVENNGTNLRPQDHPPKAAAIYCRHYFNHLQLLPLH